MKRTMICAILCLVLTLALFAAPQAALATEEPTPETAAHTHCVCGGTATTLNGHACDATVTWEPFTGTLADGGHYYLTQKTSIAQLNIPAGYEVSICLNGQKLYNPNGRVFDVKAGSSDSNKTILTVCDCRFTVADGVRTFAGEVSTKKYTATVSLFYVRDKAAFNIYGGNFTADVEADTRSAIGGTASGARLTMYDGRFYGGNSTGNGGSFYMGGGTVSLYGGVFEGGQANFGGNIFVNGGNLTIGGCVIRDGYAATSGGNIYNKGGNITVNGTTISGGKAEADGGNIWNNATLAIQNSKTRILDGTAVRGGNLFSATKTTMTYGTISGGVASDRGGNIYGIFATKEDTACGPIIKDGKSGVIWDAETNAYVESDGANRSGGNYYVSGATTLVGAQFTGGDAMTEGGNLCIGSGVVVTLTDCTVTGGNSVEQSGNIYNGGNLTLNGSTCVTGGTRQHEDIRNLYCGSNSKLTVSGTVTIDGGVSVNSNVKSLVLSGTPVIARYDEEGQLITGVRQLYTITNAENVGVVIDATGLEEGAVVAVDTHVKPYTFANLGTTGYAGAFVPATTTGIISSGTDAEGNVTLTMLQGVVRAVNGGQNGAPYLTIAEAMADENATHVRLLYSVTEDVVLNGDLILDLNGQTLTGSVTGTGKLYGMDSDNDTFDAAKCGRIKGQVTVEMATVNDLLTAQQVGAARRYMPIADETGYTFHRVELAVTHVSLDTANKGFGYKARFAGDSVVLAQLDSFGFDLQLEGKSHSVTRALAAQDLDVEKTYSLRIHDYDILTYGETPVNAKVFMKLKDGSVIETATVSYSMKTMLQKVAQALESFTQTQIQGIQDMLSEDEIAAMAGWGIDALLNWVPNDQPEEDETPEAPIQ